MVRVDYSGLDWSSVGIKIGKRLDGCRRCGNHDIMYSSEYDALFCQSCNRWLESKCNDKYCRYCSDRPSTPIDALHRAKRLKK